MTAFKPGDKVTIPGTFEVRMVGETMAAIHIVDGGPIWFRNESLKPTHPPAPKAEHESVPIVAWVGDEYGDNDGNACRVFEVRPNGDYAVTHVAGVVMGGPFERGQHRKDGCWHLLKRGSAPVPTPEAKREWRVGDIVSIGGESGEWELIRPTVNGNWTVHSKALDSVNTVYPTCFTLVRPAPTPEPAKAAGMTAGEKLHLLYHQTSGITPRWAHECERYKDGWERFAAALAAQPSDGAKGEREVVGYLVFDKEDDGTCSYFGSADWGDRGEVGKPLSRQDCLNEMRRLREGDGRYRKPGRLVLRRVTRRRRVTP